MGSLFTRKDFRDPKAIAIERGFAGLEQGCDFGGQIGRDDLVGIKVENPIILASIFREALLLAVTGPRLRDDAGSCLPRYILRPIRRTGIDHKDIVAEWPYRG
jgi:hypothetical protein